LTHSVFLETRVIAYIFAADSMGLSSFKLMWLAPKDASFWNTVRIGRSCSSKVIEFGTNRKRVCDFLLVRNSNLGPILHRFRDIIVFMCSRPHPYSTLILGVFPLQQIAHVGVSVSRDRAVKLFSKYSNLCDHGTWTLQTDRQTDGRTDRGHAIS